MGFLLGLRELSDNSIDLHLHGGEWITEHLAVPETDTSTCAASGRPYIDLHWIFQVAVFGAYPLGGFTVLSNLNALVATLLLALLALSLSRLGAGPASSCWALLAAGRFLLEKGLDGAILNSSHFGGWLGWVLRQPVYLDMRLEVIGEDLFREEADSWNAGGLATIDREISPAADR